MLSQFSPEVELMLHCGRVHLDAERAERIVQIVSQPDLDWQYILLASWRNRLRPLLYHHLSRDTAVQSAMINTSGVSADVMNQLARSFWQNRFTNLAMTRELLRLFELLAEAGIATLPYKGVALTQVVYGDLSLRHVGDLDIIVPELEARRARDVLCAHGYVQTWPDLPLNAAQEKQHIRTKYNYTLQHKATEGLEVEIHWSVTNRYLNCPPDPARLWQRLTRVMLAGQAVSFFTPEDLLIILCVHGSNHCWNRLAWVVDIAETIRTYPALDWDYLMAEAERWHARRMVMMGLYLARTLLETAVPEEVWVRVVGDETAVSLAQQSHKWLFSREFLPFSPFEEPYYHWRMLDGRVDRWHYAQELTQPSAKDWAFVHLPDGLQGLYYVIRPFRLLIEHGLNLLPGRAATLSKKIQLRQY